MLSPKPQRLRREMWLGELIKEWLAHEDADQDAWNEMREAAAKENEEGYESESYGAGEEEEEEKEKDNIIITKILHTDIIRSQQPYSSTSSSFSPSSISSSAASSIRLMQLMQLTRGINREVTLNETERQFPQSIQGARVLNSASTQPIAQRIHPIILCGDLSAPSLEDPALRFLLQGVETQTHTSLCQSGVVTRALVAPSMTNGNVEMADTSEKMKRKELTPKRI
ncbi:uncharacterized protein MONOS_7670 [Monocercomonoides exilis]|uniref:uncharacterized protein n=1 Tax=Monocercomonoides exilis TaxID=2049356 RepID=UPI00355A2EF5|nr:hypothetical protein MONOS_7670 [Monocercomonoides exilis]|eukprot:MONOS_7670.1-p1 / transcript=MONOS_7670.1 / gene=MONOS_7670 / organism=Monocercomonoides_exilis_PA203 / gene_product=hypothetical protein / transcript_product=hypothetical protein / location=Mono_scaffold00268:21189-22193(+) / protein_length=226 / sequence_SO=supercontig / SO=protein_coding / is_pseudo=false